MNAIPQHDPELATRGRPHARLRSARRWLVQRLDTLRIKLFFIIAGAQIVLVAGAWLIHGWSFDQGLVEYLNQADAARLTPLVARLAEEYEQHGSWQSLAQNRQRWQGLVSEVLGVGRSSRPLSAPPSAPAGAASEPGLPRPARLSTIDPRMLLLDRDRQVLVGPAERAAEAVLRPIESHSHVVGYLGYTPRLHIAASLEGIFLQQQSRRFAAISLGLLCAALANAALISAGLSRRLLPLRQGTTALARGEFGRRIPVRGHDELAALAHDFNQLAEALAAARHARQQWIADIAHELRTPLAALRAEIEALEDGVRTLDDKGLGSLAQEVGRLTRLVEDLHLLSLSDLGALSYHKEAHDLAELVEDGMLAARPALREQKLELRLSLTTGLRVHADGERLSQVIGNLLQNTLRYTDAPARLEVVLKQDDGWAELVWQDSAPCVPAQDLPRLGERLFRIDGSRARSSGGSGLGLAITRAIVEAHGGDMCASASPLGGLRWTLRLPLLGPSQNRHG